MTKLNGLWTGTPLADQPIDSGVARLLARDAVVLERAAAAVRQSAGAAADPAAATKILTRAEGLEAQAARIWRKFNEIVDGD